MTDLSRLVVLTADELEQLVTRAVERALAKTRPERAVKPRRRAPREAALPAVTDIDRAAARRLMRERGILPPR